MMVIQESPLNTRILCILPPKRQKKDRIGRGRLRQAPNKDISIVLRDLFFPTFSGKEWVLLSNSREGVLEKKFRNLKKYICLQKVVLPVKIQKIRCTRGEKKGKQDINLEKKHTENGTQSMREGKKDR